LVPVALSGVLGGYRITGRLGSGGTGTVWRALQLSTQRQVALKVLSAGEFSSQRAKRRFDREVEIASRLEHPNIARVYDTATDRGTCFFTMELIDGLPLDEYVYQHQLGQRSALSLMRTVCHAIQYAHQKGVIHRDLKPSNILVDQSGSPRVVDFGLGKFLDGHALAPTISVQGEWAGTPAYMSPEQAMGNPDQIDTRTDIYTLGVITYQLVTGRLPYETGGGNMAVLQRIIHEDILRPQKACREVNGELEALLLKAMAKRPNDRYNSAGALAEDIDNYLDGEPLSAAPHTAVYFLRKKFAKRRKQLVAIAVALMVLVTLTIYASVRIAHERNLAVAAAASERSLRHTSDGRLADSLESLAYNLQMRGRWPEAEDKYWDAYRIQTTEGISPISAQIGLLETAALAPREVIKFPSAKLASLVPLRVFFDPDGKRIWSALLRGPITSADLLTGRAGPTIGAVFQDGQVLYVSDHVDDHFIFRLVRRHNADGSPYSYFEKVNLHDGTITNSLKTQGLLEQPVALSDHFQYVICGDLRDAPQKELWIAEVRPSGNGRTIAPPNDRMVSIAFSPDGSAFCTVDRAGHIQFFPSIFDDEAQSVDLDIPSSLLTGTPQSGGLAYFPDGNGVLVGDLLGRLTIVSQSPQLAQVPFGNCDARATVLEFSHDGRNVLSGDETGRLSVWDVQTRELRRTCVADAGIVCAQFSPDDKLVVAGAGDGSIYVWPVDEAGQPIIGHTQAPPSAFAVSPDGLIVAIAALDQVQILDIATGHLLQTLSVDDKVSSLGFSSDGAKLNVATEKGEINGFAVFGQWKQVAGYIAPAVAKNPPSTAPRQPGVPAHAVYFSSGSNVALDLNYDKREAALVDSANGRRLSLDQERFRLGCISSDAGMAIVVREFPRMALEFFDLEGKPIRSIYVEPPVRPTALAISPDARTTYLARPDSTIEAINSITSASIWKIASRQQFVKCLQVSPDGTMLLSGGEDGTLRLRKARDGSELRIVASNLGSVSAVLFSKAGNLILCGGARTSGAYLWDLAKPLRLREAEQRAADARSQLSGDPSNPSAIASIVEWYSLRQRFELGRMLLDETQADSAAGLAAARCRWQANDFAAAARDFQSLINRDPQHDRSGYLQACLDAVQKSQR
jgi:WD40 repeat protein